MDKEESTSKHPLPPCLSGVSFWVPNWFVPESAWIEHAPFAFWLVETLRPKTIVELGTYSGYSYFVFCQAVQQLRLDTSCYAVDTWEGDEQTGFYGNSIHDSVVTHNARHYSAFSSLIRSSFSEALKAFDARSIALLHIDGLHTYEAVKSDYENWLPRVSSPGVVLFHDTNVRERNFGVWRLFDELKQKNPFFEFAHGYGLGVIGVGTGFPSELQDLFDSVHDADQRSAIQYTYSRLGQSLYAQMTLATINAHKEQLAGFEEKNRVLEEELRNLKKRQTFLTARISQADANIKARDAEIKAREAEIKTLEDTLEEFRDPVLATIGSASHESGLLNWPLRAAIGSLRLIHSKTR